jgi:anaerobic selenocysteine-containing dehydrogenase
VINIKRRRFLQLSIVTAAALAQETKLLAENLTLNNHQFIYKFYEDEFLFMYGKNQNQGVVEDFNIWTNSSIITRENQTSIYKQIDFSTPDLNPRGSAYEASYSQIVYQKDRLIYPMKRIGKRAEGRWIRIDWDDALKEVAQNIWDMMVDPMYGPRYLTCKTNNTMSDSSISSVKRFSNIIGANLDLKKSRKNKITTDVFENDLIILWGYNPMVSNVQDAHLLQECRYKGVKIVTICPEYNATAKHSDIWVPVKTNSDDFLALRVLLELLNSVPQDENFSTRNENLIKKIQMQSQADFQDLTGIHESVIKKLVNYMLNAKSIRIMCGKGYAYNSKIDKILNLLKMKAYNKGNKVEKLAYLSDFNGRYKPRLENIEDTDEGQMAILLSSSLFSQKPRDYKENILDKIRYLVCLDTRVNETVLYADMILPLKGKYETHRVGRQEVDENLNVYAKPPVGIEEVGESRDEWSIFSQILKEMEKIANKQDNLQYSKVEDLQEYALSGFRDLSTIYEEFSKLKYMQKEYIIRDNKSIYDIVLENENNNEDVTNEATTQKIDTQDIVIKSDEKTVLPKKIYNLILANSRYSYGLIHNTNRVLLRLQRGVPFVLINPLVAKMYDIKDGEDFNIYNDMGKLKVMAKYSNLVSTRDLIINKAYESYLFSDNLGYNEVLREDERNVVKIKNLKESES